jgi:hypothetical protein
MQVHEERDPAFWRAVAAHPAVGPMILQGQSLDVIDAIVAHPDVLPLASNNGGLMFTARDQFGKVKELHTLYRPEGWGREVAVAAKHAFERVFSGGADLVFTQENLASWRTRPPKSFGFKPLGEAFVSELGTFRTWGLLAADWLASPARVRWMGA